MTRLTIDELRAAWWKPGRHEDPDRDFERRLEAVQDAVLKRVACPDCNGRGGFTQFMTYEAGGTATSVTLRKEKP